MTSVAKFVVGLVLAIVGGGLFIVALAALFLVNWIAAGVVAIVAIAAFATGVTLAVQGARKLPAQT